MTTTHVSQLSTEADVREAHSALLAQRRAGIPPNELIAAIKAFIAQARLSGALIDNPAERTSIESVLTYWATALYRLSETEALFETDLIDFDPLQAPDLKDKECPYVGLAPFDIDTRQWFQGRDAMILDLVECVQHHRLVVLTGPSGSGKSSLLRAGLLPMLREGIIPATATTRSSERWTYIGPIVPGNDPLASLTEALPPPPYRRPLVVTIDQFEETFTLCDNQSVRDRFVGRLLELCNAAEQPHRVLLTIRDDFRYLLENYPGLGNTPERGLVELRRLTRDDMRSAIEVPAAQVGLKIAPEVVERLLDDLAPHIAGLPLLQFTLRRLWEEKDRNRVTLETYHKVGGGLDALTRAAEAFVKAHPLDVKAIERILLRMLRPGNRGTQVNYLEVTSNRVRRSDLFHLGLDRKKVSELLEALIEAGLVRETPGKNDEDTQIELAHEALVRNWDRLRDTADRLRGALPARRVLDLRVEEWQRLGSGEAGLLGAAELHEAEVWVDSFDATEVVGYNPALHDLIKASRWKLNEVAALEQQRQHELEKAQDRELISLRELNSAKERELAAQRALERAKARGRLRIILLVCSGIAVVLVLGGYQLLRALEVQKQLRAQQLALIANDQINEQPERALLLAYESVIQPSLLSSLLAAEPTGNRLSEQVLRDALERLTWAEDRTGNLTRTKGYVTAFVHDDQSGLTATGYGDGWVILWKDDAVQWSTRVFSSSIQALALSSGGALVASSSYDGAIKISTVGKDAGSEQILQGHTDTVRTLAFAPDNRLVSGGLDQTVRFWDLTKGSEVLNIAPNSGTVNRVAVSADGSRIAAALSDRVVIIWDKDGAEVAKLLGHLDWVQSVAFDHAGKYVVTASSDRTARIWSVTGDQLAVLSGHNEAVFDAAFNADDTQIISASTDQTVRIWATGGQLLHVISQNCAASQARFTTNQTVLTRACGNMHRWHPSEPTYPTLRGHSSFVYQASYSPDGKTILTASADGTARLWKLDGKLEHVFSTPTEKLAITSANFSPDGKRIVTGGGNGVVRIWDIAGKELAVLKGHTEIVLDVVFSPDGRQVLSASMDKTLRLWSLDGTLQRTFEGHEGSVLSAAFSSDGRKIISSSADSTARIWDSASGKQLALLKASENNNWVYTATFSRDGRLVVTGSGDGTALLWDVSQNEPKLLVTFSGHTNDVRKAIFSPDQTQIVTASADRTVRFWSLAGQQLMVIHGHNDRIWSVNFSPDGKRLLTASDDTTARQYPVQLQDLLRLVECRTTTRTLTDAEVRQFNIPTPLKKPSQMPDCPG